MLQAGCISIVGKESVMASRRNVAEKNVAVKKKKRMTRRQRQKRKLLILGIEVLCLLLLLGVLYAWSLWKKIDINSDFSNSEVGINEDLDAGTLQKLDGYTNVAIFGLDNRSTGKYESGHSDVIMVASINNKTKEVKLVSVYRDTYLNVGSGKYNKANSAYMRGGPKQAVKMLNTNLDLDIKEYISVDWSAVIEAVDALGGIELEITEAEIKHLNMYVRDMGKEIGSDTTQIKKAGKQKLNGAQATAYARIRYTKGMDFERSSRQRIVLEAMLNKAKGASLTTLINICETVFDDVSTSLELKEILSLAKHVKEYKIVSTTGFPFEMTTMSLSGSGSSVVPIGLEDDVTMLHEYMFGTEGYEPSKTVQVISDAIITKTGVTEEYKSIDVDSFNDTAGQTGTVFKQEESTETED